MKYYFIYSSTIEGRGKSNKNFNLLLLVKSSNKIKTPLLPSSFGDEGKMPTVMSFFSIHCFFPLRIFLTYTYKKLLIDRRNVAWSIVEDLSKESRLPFLVSFELDFFFLFQRSPFYFGWEYHSDIRIRRRDWNKCRSEFLVTLP